MVETCHNREQQQISMREELLRNVEYYVGRASGKVFPPVWSRRVEQLVAEVAAQFPATVVTEVMPQKTVMAWMDREFIRLVKVDNNKEPKVNDVVPLLAPFFKPGNLRLKPAVRQEQMCLD